MGGCASRDKTDFADFDFSDDEFPGIVSIYEELNKVKLK